MNCGHGGLCYDCAIDLWKRKQVCYLCRDVNFIYNILVNRFSVISRSYKKIREFN